MTSTTDRGNSDDTVADYGDDADIHDGANADPLPGITDPKVRHCLGLCGPPALAGPEVLKDYARCLGVYIRAIGARFDLDFHVAWDLTEND